MKSFKFSITAYGYKWFYRKEIRITFILFSAFINYDIVLLRQFIFSVSADIFLRSKKWNSRGHEKTCLGILRKTRTDLRNTFLLLASQLSYKTETSTYFNRENVNISYLLTPWSRVLLEKLTGSAASQEIPRIFGTRRFLTVFTSARHMSLSWASSIQSIIPHPTSWRAILTLNLLTTTIVVPPSNASKWQMGFNSAFKGLILSPSTPASTQVGSFPQVSPPEHCAHLYEWDLGETLHYLILGSILYVTLN